MICPKCGNPVEDAEAKFCNACGASLQSPVTSNYENVVSQQERPVTKPAEPNDYLVFAILTTVLCCLPFGIYAIVCSTRVGKYYGQGDYERAQEESDKAKKWSIIALCCGIAVMAIYGLCMLLGLAAAGSAYSGY